ncbi:MAG: hypothetical protein ACYS67_17480 [Planctomycetota bacterium]|jgi:hypothetical protein
MWKDLVFEIWWTKQECTTDTSGFCHVSAFLGEYEVIVEHAGRTITANVTVDKTGQVKTIRL